MTTQEKVPQMYGLRGLHPLRLVNYDAVVRRLQTADEHQPARRAELKLNVPATARVREVGRSHSICL